MRGEVADATRQAAAALSISGGVGGGAGGSGSGSSKQGRGSKGLRHEQRADTAAGAAAVDPNSPGVFVCVQPVVLVIGC